MKNYKHLLVRTESHKKFKKLAVKNTRSKKTIDYFDNVVDKLMDEHYESKKLEDERGERERERERTETQGE